MHKVYGVFKVAKSWLVERSFLKTFLILQQSALHSMCAAVPKETFAKKNTGIDSGAHEWLQRVAYAVFQFFLFFRHAGGFVGDVIYPEDQIRLFLMF